MPNIKSIMNNLSRPPLRFLQESDPLMKIYSRKYNVWKRGRCDSESTSSGESNSSEIVKRKISRLTFPIIPKRDLRRYYGNMFVNAFNSAQTVVFAQFLNEYAMTDISYISPVDDIKIATEGRNRMIMSHIYRFATVPDFNYRVIEANIKQFVDNSFVEVIIEVVGEGNQIFQFEPEHIYSQLHATQTNDNFEDCFIDFSRGTCFNCPCKLSFRATFTIVINESFLIKQISQKVL